MGSASNLSELTVTCTQCGSASMERLGPREYRCNHCGAITVVSQDQQNIFDQVVAASQQKIAADRGAVLSPGQEAAAVAAGAVLRKGVNVGRFIILAGVLVVILIGVINALTGGSSSQSPSSSPPSTPTVDGKLASMSQPVWLSDPSSSVNSGRFVSMLTNRSSLPIQVPQYTMTLYTNGVKGATATSQAPLARLLPGEYEPVAFVFETPDGDARSEITTPDKVQTSSDSSPLLVLSGQQLIQEAGRREYRIVGLVKNPGKTGISAAQVLIMIFGANHRLLGYGSGYVQSLRPGEQAAVDVHMPTAITDAVTSYEYLVDATAEDN